MKETSKNIIFFLPNFSKGGSGYAILKLCGHLKNKGFKLHVICIGKCALKKELLVFRGYNDFIALVKCASKSVCSLDPNRTGRPCG